MTTLLALRKDGVSYLASDTRAINGDLVISSSQPKILSWGRFAVAFTGGARLLNLIEHYGNERKEDSPWSVAQEIRRLMLDDGWISASDAQTGERMFGVSGFIAGPDDVHLFCASGSLVKLEEGVPLGRGSGAEAAQAACRAALYLGKDDYLALHLGVSAACSYDVYSGGHVQVVTISADGILRTFGYNLVQLR